MLRVHIEIGGSTIGQLRVENDGTGNSAIASYNCELTYFENGSWRVRQWKVEGFVRERGAIALVATALTGTRHVRHKAGRNDPFKE